MKTPAHVNGVTLIELMVTLAILAIVAAIAIPAYSGYVEAGRRGECQNEVAAIRLAEEEFFLEQNTYFAGANMGELETNSEGFYTRSYGPDDVPNCSYSVAAGGSGIATSYVITATGINKLAGKGTIVEVEH